MSLAAPILSSWDPTESGEGSIDPLSLQPTYERLAERLYPFITVRMQRPRFLTVIAALARTCEGLEEARCSDEVTPAWLVGEWYVVEAFVRRRERISKSRRFGIPGTQKVERAIRIGRTLGPAAYLKTPKVFGFTGVYKTLALGLGIVTGDHLTLDEAGYQLLRVWEREQELEGFLDGTGGAGARFRDELRKAIEVGLRKGHTDRSSSWTHWDELVRRFDPGAAGVEEGAWIRTRITASSTRTNPRDPEACEMRREIIHRLESAGRPIVEPKDETAFFREAIADAHGASPGLRERLSMIDAYEGVGRCIEDALSLVLHLSSESGGSPVAESDFEAHPLSVELAKPLAHALDRLRTTFDGTGWESEVENLIERYTGVDSPRALYRVVLEHHHEAQRLKPPDGKRPWVENLGTRGVVVRSQYRRSDPPTGADEYAHDYRSSTATQFLQDLGRLPR